MMNRNSEQSKGYYDYGYPPGDGSGSLVAAAGVVVVQNLLPSSPLQQQQQQHHDRNDDAVVAAPTSIIAPPTTLPPRRVDHTYRDFSNFPIDELPAARGKRTPTNFPSKLHQILSNPEYAHIISWMPHGRAWKIHNKELLVQDIAPKYFVHSKYESFTRQLNGWGFKRLHQSGNDFNAFYHECFLKGMPHLTVLMKRVPPNQGKLLPHVEGEPNFYEIDQHYPLPPHPPRNNSNIIINLNVASTMMSSRSSTGSTMMPSAYNGGAAAPGGYYGGYGACLASLPPYDYHPHPQQHHPAANDNLRNPFSSHFPGTTMSSYPAATRGDCQQGRIGVVEPAPFLAPNIIGQHPSTMMGGLMLPPPAQSYHDPNPFDDSMVYRHDGAPVTSSLPIPTRTSFVQDTPLCCAGDESSGANSCTNKSNQ